MPRITLSSLIAEPAVPNLGTRHAATEGKLVDGFSDLANWSPANATITQVTTDPEFPRCMKVAVASGATATVDRDVFLGLRRKSLSFWIKCLDNNLSVAKVRCATRGRSLNPAASSNFYNSGVYGGGTGSSDPVIITNRWKRVVLPGAAFTKGGSTFPTDAEIDDLRLLRLELVAKASQTADVLIADLRVHDNPLRDGFVLIFDDARDDTYTTAFPILAARGYVGVIPVITGQIDTGRSDRCTSAQLREMQAAGWEMVSHSVTHTPHAGLSLSALQTELRDSYNWLIANGFSKKGARHYVYPGGSYNETVLNETLRHYDTARAIVNLNVQHSAPYVNDFGAMGTVYMGETTTLATAKARLDEIAGRGAVTLITFHGIIPTPGNGSVDWSVENFTALMDYAKSLGLRSYVMSDLYGRT